MLEFTKSQKEEIEKLLNTKIKINSVRNNFPIKFEKIYVLTELNIHCDEDDEEFEILSVSKNSDNLRKIIENKINEFFEKTDRRFNIEMSQFVQYYLSIYGVETFSVHPNTEVWIFSKYRWEICEFKIDQ